MKHSLHYYNKLYTLQQQNIYADNLKANKKINNKINKNKNINRRIPFKY
jgi:hypothetical protein